MHPERARAFVEWHARFQADADALAAARGLDEVKRLLARMLGDDTAVMVMKEYTDRMTANRGTGGLTIAKSTTGAIGVAASTAASPGIRANTFFGNE